MRIASLLAMLALAACSTDGLPSTETDGGSPPPPDLSRIIDFDQGLPATCGRTQDRITVDAKTWDGRAWSCSPDRPGPGMTYEGVVTSVDASAFTTDSCPPNADCVGPMASTWSFSAPGLPPLSTVIARGAFVSVAVSTTLTPGGCIETLDVHELPSWGGVADPVGPRDGRIYLILADGTPVSPDVDLGVTPEALGCYPGQKGCSGQPPDDYRLAFSFTQGGASPIARVLMGQQAMLVHGAQALLVRDVSSYDTGACDAGQSWSWWASDLSVTN